MLLTVPGPATSQQQSKRSGHASACRTATESSPSTRSPPRPARLPIFCVHENIAPGEPVAISLRNSCEALWVSVGMRLAGVAETALNDALGDAERRYCLSLSGARRVITTRAETATFAALGCQAIAVEDLPPGPADLASLPPVPGDATSRISFTSGTTGQPKAIVQTHAARWIGTILQQASHSTAPGPGKQHLADDAFRAWRRNAQLCLHAARRAIGDPRRRAARSVSRRCWTRGRVDHIFAPPTVLAKIAAAFAGRSFAGIRMIFCGTAPLLAPLYFSGEGDVRTGDPRDLRQDRDQQPDHRPVTRAMRCLLRGRRTAATASVSGFRAPAWRWKFATRWPPLRHGSGRRGASCADATWPAAISTPTAFNRCPTTGFMPPAISAASMRKACCIWLAAWRMW